MLSSNNIIPDVLLKLLLPEKYHKAIRELDNRQLDHNDHVDSNSKYALRILAHNIKTPQNIGSLFRLADAMGIEHLHLSGYSPVPPNDKIRKTSRATEKSVAHSYCNDPVSVIEKLKQDQYRIISLELTSSSIDISKLSINRQRKICLILGSETNGITPELLSLSDMTVHIPMLGQNSSMNVAMACAIAVYEISKQLTKATKKTAT